MEGEDATGSDWEGRVWLEAAKRGRVWQGGGGMRLVVAERGRVWLNGRGALCPYHRQIQ